MRMRLLMGATLILGCARSPASIAPVAAPDLRAASAAYAQSSGDKDVDRIVSFFAPGVVVMSPQGRRPVVGIDANRAAWQRFFAGKNPVHTMTSDSVEVSSSRDMGYSRGTWHVGVDTPNGRAEADGEYLAVWQLTGGHWKIVALSAFTFR